VSYRVQLSLPAKKQLDRLDQVTTRRLDDRLKELAFDPYATRISKPVKMKPGQRTSRVGDWRIIYRVNEISREIMVIAFRPRGKAYR
jgi:mRNA interferase RelE/StbE